MYETLLRRTTHEFRRSSRRRRATAGIVLALALGCVDSTSPNRLAVLDLNILTNAPLVRTLHLSLGEVAPLTVDYWTTDGPRLRLRSEPAAAHDVVFTRLLPARRYQFLVNDGAITGTFTTDTLPTTLAQLRFEASGSTDQMVMMHLYDPNGFRGFVAVDGGGNVVWYWPTVDLPFGMTRRANGNFVLFDKGRGLVELTPAQRVLHELPQDTSREMHHDVLAAGGDTVLFIAYDDRQYQGQPLRGDAIWAWLPETGESFRIWSAWDHFDPAVDRGPRTGTEWMHANALGIGPRGNVTLSVHFWNQVVSIAPGWQSIEWRLGGTNATIPVRQADAFSGQHSARELPDGHVLLFDNGIAHAGPSRAIELATDGDSAHAVWTFDPPTPNYATALGTARRLANGHTMVQFGMSAGLAGSSGPVEVYEVDAAGGVVWHLVARGAYLSYRAEPLSTIGGEAVVP